MVKPNLFIVGAPKAGTTSVYEYLKKHPDVYFPRLKEPNYFSSKEIISQKLYYKVPIIKTESSYLSLYSQHKNQKIIGDASVSYLYYPKVAARIRNYNPDAKIIIILRDPIQRAFSHYLMDYRLGYINVEFENIYYDKEKYPLHYQQYFLVSKYYEQVKRYIEIFNDNCTVLFFDDLKSNPIVFMNQVYSFLGIDSINDVDYKKYNQFVVPRNRFWKYMYSNSMVRVISKIFIPGSIRKAVKKAILPEAKKPVINSELKNELIKYFKNDIIMLEQLLNVDLSKWYSEI